MARVWLGLGSNQRRYFHINAALDALQQQFGELVISPVYESAAIGFDGEPFLNLVVGIETELALGDLTQWLKALEDRYHRARHAPRLGDKTLDIDILTYADWVGDFDGVVLPREEITCNAFVLWPLSDVAGDEHHPVLARPYGKLWQSFDKSSQQLAPVPFRRQL